MTHKPSAPQIHQNTCEVIEGLPRQVMHQQVLHRASSGSKGAQHSLRLNPKPLNPKPLNPESSLPERVVNDHLLGFSLSEAHPRFLSNPFIIR